MASVCYKECSAELTTTRFEAGGHPQARLRGRCAEDKATPRAHPHQDQIMRVGLAYPQGMEPTEAKPSVTLEAFQTSTDPIAIRGQLAYLPVGSFEQHGSSLPLATDAFIAAAISDSLCEAQPGLVLPPVPVSCSHEHANWRGTISVPLAVAASYVDGVVRSLLVSGYKKVVLVSGHGGNYFLGNIAQQNNVESPQILVFPTRRAQNTAYLDAGLTSNPHSDMHAGEYELSIALHCGFALESPADMEPNEAEQRELLTLFGMRAFTQAGHIGHPEAATRAKGERILESYQRSFARIMSAWGRELGGGDPHGAG